MSIFKKIGQFFVGLFNAAKKAYNKLTPEQQAALVHGSGVIAVINSMTGEAPEAVRKAILEKFPDLDVEKLEIGLFQVANAFNLTDFGNLDDCIAALQKHLASVQGKVWAAASHAAASLLAILFAPKETKFAAIASLIEWVFQNFIKKSIPDGEDNE